MLCGSPSPPSIKHILTHFEPQKCWFVLRVLGVVKAGKRLLIFEPTHYVEPAITTCPVQAWSVSNRTEFHRMMLLLLDPPLGLDQESLFVQH
jgi:hypothetical protein